MKIRGCTGIGQGGCGGRGDDPGNVGGHDLGLGGEARVGAGAAVNHEYLVLMNELLDRTDRFRGLAAVVLAHVLDLAAVNSAGLVGLPVYRFDAVVDGVAELGVGTGQDAERANLDRVVGHAGFGRGRRDVHPGSGEQRGGCACRELYEFHPEFSSLSWPCRERPRRNPSRFFSSRSGESRCDDCEPGSGSFSCPMSDERTAHCARW